MKTTTPFALIAPTRESLRGYIIPTPASADSEALISEKRRAVEEASTLARNLGHALLRRCVRVGAHFALPVNALAPDAVARHRQYEAARTAISVAGGLRAVAPFLRPWALPARVVADAISAAAQAMTVAYDVVGVHRSCRTSEEDVRRGLALIAQHHAALDDLLSEAEEVRHVIYDAVDGGLYVGADRTRSGKTFVEYSIPCGVLRVDHNSTHRFARV